MSFNPFQKPLLGVDISDYSISILELNNKKDVTSYARRVLPAGVVKNGEVVEKNAFIKIVRKLCASAKPNPISLNGELHNAILSVPESKAFVHTFAFPASFQGAVLEKAILAEAAQNIPVASSSLYCDWQVAPSGTDKTKNIIVYVGALRKTVDSLVEACNLAGISPIAVEIESLSLGRALLLGRQKNKSPASTIIIDIGAFNTSLSIFDERKILEISITVHVGGQHFTSSISQHLKITLAEAEKIKQTYGFNVENQNNKVVSILQGSFQEILVEAKGAAEYYEKHGRQIGEIVLAGGGALLPNVTEYLSANLDNTVRIGNSLNNRFGPLAATVAGLGLRGVSRNPESSGINLLRFFGAEATAKVVTTVPDSGVAKSVFPKALGVMKNGNIFVILFLVIAFAILGFVLLRYF